MISQTVAQALGRQPPPNLVLDLGGWFKPLDEATHVVDLMPYETRRGILSLQPLPGERFDRSTWIQADFLERDLRLPFSDQAFSFVHCGHTLEDLADPAPLLAEILRIAKAGCIRCPTRLSEQTRGVRDRISSAPGHPHHHWIVDVLGGGLRFCAKDDSALSAPGVTLPLRHYERLLAGPAGPTVGEFNFAWSGSFTVEFVRGRRAAGIARGFARSQPISLSDRLLDPSVRRLRRLKHRWLHRPAPAAVEDWWAKMLELSRPYSSIALN